MSDAYSMDKAVANPMDTLVQSPNSLDSLAGMPPGMQQIAARRSVPQKQAPPDFMSMNEQQIEQLPDDVWIKNIDQFPGLFEPVRDEMQGDLKPFADKAKELTSKIYELYKSGDSAAIDAIHKYETQVIGKGYTQDEIGERMRREALQNYGSKEGRVSRQTIWAMYMQIYQGLLGQVTELEQATPEDREGLEQRSTFDAGGRPMIKFDYLWDKVLPEAGPQP